MRQVKDCEFYINEECNCGTVFGDLASITKSVKCKDNENCYFKQVLRIEKENDAIKNGYGQNCESCSSRIELKNIRDIHNRLVPLKENQLVINYSDLQMHGIAFVTVDQMKEYFEIAYNARNEQAKANYAKHAKHLVEEVIRDIQTGLNSGRIGGI